MHSNALISSSIKTLGTEMKRYDKTVCNIKCVVTIEYDVWNRTAVNT